MSNKTKVIRVTEQEEQLIGYLRGNNSEVVKELENVLSELDNKKDISELRAMLSLLRKKQIFHIDTLVSSGYISQENADILIDAMNSNKNIIISGKIRTGKTTLLNALLPYQSNVVLTVIENIRELQIYKSSMGNINNNNVEVRTTTNLLTNMSEIILQALKNKQDRRLVIGEAYMEEDLLSLLSGLKMGYSVLTTTIFNTNWKKGFINRLSNPHIPLNDLAKDINNYNFVVVHTDKDSESNEMKVVSITEE